MVRATPWLAARSPELRALRESTVVQPTLEQRRPPSSAPGSGPRAGHLPGPSSRPASVRSPLVALAGRLALSIDRRIGPSTDSPEFDLRAAATVQVAATNEAPRGLHASFVAER